MAGSAPLKLQYALNKNICQIHCIYTIHGCKCSSKINSIHWGVDERNSFRETKEHCTGQEKLGARSCCAPTVHLK